jgi:hypothetical protein
MGWIKQGYQDQKLIAINNHLRVYPDLDSSSRSANPGSKEESTGRLGKISPTLQTSTVLRGTRKAAFFFKKTPP